MGGDLAVPVEDRTGMGCSCPLKLGLQPWASQLGQGCHREAQPLWATQSADKSHSDGAGLGSGLPHVCLGTQGPCHSSKTRSQHWGCTPDDRQPPQQLESRAWVLLWYH